MSEMQKKELKELRVMVNNKYIYRCRMVAVTVLVSSLAVEEAICSGNGL